jgi:hypothetical protein
MKLFFNVFFALALSCTHNSQENLNSGSHNYFPELEKESKKASFYKDFETVYLLNATRISDKFRQAFKLRKNDSVPEFKNELDKLPENQISFIISLYTPFEDLENLKDSAQWNIILKIDDKIVTSKSIKKLAKKGAWDKFFPYINTWTNEYLVTFKVTKEEAKPSKTVLLLSNARSKTTLTW